jgi:hypothetical protein
MKNLKIKLENLENKLENLFIKEDEILRNIEKSLNDEIISARVSYFVWTNAIKINITPKSAWTSVIEVIITKDKVITNTSSGGWNDETKALEEFTHCFNKLTEFVKNFDRSIIDVLKVNNKKINKVSKEIEELQKEIKINEKAKNYKKVDINELIEKAKNGEVVEFFELTTSNCDVRHVMIYNGRNFKIDNKVIGVKRIPDIFKNIYVKLGV